MGWSHVPFVYDGCVARPPTVQAKCQKTLHIMKFYFILGGGK